MSKILRCLQKSEMLILQINTFVEELAQHQNERYFYPNKGELESLYLSLLYYIDNIAYQEEKMSYL